MGGGIGELWRAMWVPREGPGGPGGPLGGGWGALGGALGGAGEHWGGPGGGWGGTWAGLGGLLEVTGGHWGGAGRGLGNPWGVFGEPRGSPGVDFAVYEERCISLVKPYILRLGMGGEAVKGAKRCPRGAQGESTGIQGGQTLSRGVQGEAKESPRGAQGESTEVHGIQKAPALSVPKSWVSLGPPGVY